MLSVVSRTYTACRKGALCILFPVIFLAGTDLVQAAQCVTAPGGLAGWWPAEGDANDSIKTNNGILQGGAMANATGVVGSAFNFDGTNGYVQIPDAPVFHLTNLTIECWIKFSGLDSAGAGGSPAGDQYIVFKQNSRNSSFEGFDLSKTRAENDVFRFVVSSASGQSVEIHSTTTISIGTWYHLAAVRGSNFISLYVNGQFENRAVVSFPQDYGTLPVYFGTSGQSFWDHKLKGTLDEVSFYSRALEASEIAAIYQAGAAGKCHGLSITQQPQSQTVPAGSNVTFSVTVSGTPPLTYQWQRDNTNLNDSANMAGTSSAELTLLSVQTNDSAGYRVVVTNIVGAVTSSVANLFVDTQLTPPTIKTNPQSSTSYWGSAFALTTSAVGTPPLRYQWRKDGAPVPGATDPSLVFAKLQFTNAGSYDMRVTNVYGAVTSQPATLAVKVADISISGARGSNGYLAALNISGVTGQIYGVQTCWNLSAPIIWTGVTNLFLSQSNYTWYDPSNSREQRFYRLLPGPIAVGNSPWETVPMGAVIADNFDRVALGSNWIVLADTSVAISSNQLSFTQSNVNYSRQVYYQPWETCSDSWTIRWTERFGALSSNSLGVGVGLKNFQTFGGDDRGYNAMVCGSGPNFGKMLIQRFTSSGQDVLAAGTAMSLASGDVLDCTFTRSGWNFTASVTNRANGQWSAASILTDSASPYYAPTISRLCFYPLSGTAYVDDFSFTINHRKPARFIVIGASGCEGYFATTHERGLVNVIQTNFTETVCNDSSSYNTTSDSLSVMPEILAHQPGTAILWIGGNDLVFGVPLAQAEQQYSNLVAQLVASGVKVKHAPIPRSNADLRALRSWITNSYPNDIIDTWNPLLSGAYQLNPAYDSGDGLHPNDAGHLLIGTIIRTNLP
jgi:lysophospholipase L1-like esterase